jgi:hypothetical protein
LKVSMWFGDGKAYLKDNNTVWDSTCIISIALSILSTLSRTECKAINGYILYGYVILEGQVIEW